MKSLDQILYKNMLRSSLIPLFIIELTLLLLYFTTSHFTTSQYQQRLLKQVTDSVRSTSQREADYINLRLTEVAR
jgi:cell division protein FtsL